MSEEIETFENTNADIENISRTAMAEVRQTVAGYRTSGFDAELANAKLATSAAAIALRCDTAEVTLDAEESLLLAPVLREAMTNIIRHSQATNCSVTLERTSDGLRLTIADNGLGVGGSSEGNGITGMRHRLTAAGGRLELIDDDGLRLVAELSRGNDTPDDEPALAPVEAEA